MLYIPSGEIVTRILTITEDLELTVRTDRGTVVTLPLDQFTADEGAYDVRAYLANCDLNLRGRDHPLVNAVKEAARLNPPRRP